ncbi:TetR/AcrR family transcriptional regulator [Streptomyces sp. H51]|uniref:TetR/AcrR family transcriptional regulator n=1 Tax=Streptomyces sp. H51 TaxID=3111770 RepID=UPI002D770E4F|nr:TetR/AcrR family transcriptional regulator C-terminal domain-containing protein [Streptomyces sp. H51]
MRQKPNPTDVPLPPWEVRRKTEAPPRAPLTADRIVAAALAVVDQEGSAAVTMRRIAGDLGVVASSLYAHVRNREELLLLVLEAVMKEVGVPEVTGRWDADLKAYYTKMQRVLSAHGDIALYNFAAFPPTAIGVAITERLLSVLLNVGVPAKTAAWALHRLTLYTTADVYEGWRLAHKDLDNWIDPVRDYFASLPAGQFPSIAGNVDVMLDTDSDGRFELGLNMLISGLAAFVTD